MLHLHLHTFLQFSNSSGTCYIGHFTFVMSVPVFFFCDMSHVIMPKEIENKPHLAKGKMTAVICVLITHISDYVLFFLLVVGLLSSFESKVLWHNFIMHV